MLAAAKTAAQGFRESKAERCRVGRILIVEMYKSRGGKGVFLLTLISRKKIGKKLTSDSQFN